MSHDYWQESLRNMTGVHHYNEPLCGDVYPQNYAPINYNHFVANSQKAVKFHKIDNTVEDVYSRKKKTPLQIYTLCKLAAIFFTSKFSFKI